MYRVIRSTALLATLLLLPVAQASAQQTKAEKADQVHARALELQQDQRQLVPAARLYLQEAALRGTEDIQGVKCRAVAAHLLFYGGRTAEARRVMEKTAEAAMHLGEVSAAAQYYLQAAWMAQVERNPVETYRLAHRADLLAGSALLASADRDAIKARVTQIATNKVPQ